MLPPFQAWQEEVGFQFINLSGFINMEYHLTFAYPIWRHDPKSTPLPPFFFFLVFSSRLSWIDFLITQTCLKNLKKKNERCHFSTFDLSAMTELQSSKESAQESNDDKKSQCWSSYNEKNVIKNRNSKRFQKNRIRGPNPGKNLTSVNHTDRKCYVIQAPAILAHTPHSQATIFPWSYIIHFKNLK